jgi:hypothetical protein
VIIVSDEDDFSHNGSGIIAPNYSHANLHPVSNYITYLDTLTASSGPSRRYSVSSIAIFDEACRTDLNTSFTGRLIGVRYGELSDATGGVKSSLCGNFANELSLIADNILSLATQFYLSRIPKPETITVLVNGLSVPSVTSNPGPQTGGWEYNSETNSIRFYGDYIPASGSTIAINFDPASYGS